MLTTALQTPVFSAKDALREAVLALQQARIASASLDARLLLEHVLGVSREQLLADECLVLDAAQQARYRHLIARRANRQPVAQLTGRREFWGMTLRVTEATLDPRPDSETLIEAVLERCRDRSARLRIADLGTGTGCLLLALLKEFPQACGIGIDICESALAVAKENAFAHGMQARASFVRDCWGETLEGVFDIIISNPPYIPDAAIPMLAPEVAQFEPKTALDGGKDGLDCYRALLPRLPGRLAPGGLVALEIGMGQEHAVMEMAIAQGLRSAGVRRDLGSVTRCLLFTL